MYANGFLEQQKRSPVSLAAVIGLHATALGAVILFGTTTFVTKQDRPIQTFDVPIRPPPPDVPPPPPPPDQPTSQSNPPTTVRTDIPLTTDTITAPPTPPEPYRPPVADPVPVRMASAAIPRIPDPVRLAAEVDPRFRDALQPPYPRDQEAAQRTGSVRVRITIGTDGRVSAIERIAATNDSFWRVTERQARNRWRFRPATVDGRPIVSTMVFTVTFRLPDA
jgi:protein TonB